VENREKNWGGGGGGGGENILLGVGKETNIHGTHTPAGKKKDGKEINFRKGCVFEEKGLEGGSRNRGKKEVNAPCQTSLTAREEGTPPKDE